MFVIAQQDNDPKHCSIFYNGTGDKRIVVLQMVHLKFQNSTQLQCCGKILGRLGINKCLQTQINLRNV